MMSCTATPVQFGRVFIQTPDAQQPTRFQLTLTQEDAERLEGQLLKAQPLEAGRTQVTFRQERSKTLNPVTNQPVVTFTLGDGETAAEPTVAQLDGFVTLLERIPLQMGNAALAQAVNNTYDYVAGKFLAAMGALDAAEGQESSDATQVDRAKNALTVLGQQLQRLNHLVHMYLPVKLDDAADPEPPKGPKARRRAA